MKESPDMQKLEAVLRSSKLVAGGFLGTDRRPIVEIIEADLGELERLGYTPERVAARMKLLTDLSKPRFGIFVKVATNLEVATDEHRGWIVCPWPHPGNLPKTDTIARRIDTGKQARWSTLSIHMIAAHGFFEGRGATFRLEPADLIAVIF